MNDIPVHIIKNISSYTTREISEEEFNELREWLNQSAENQQLLVDYIKFYKKSRQIAFVENFDKEEAWDKISKRLENKFLIAQNQKPTKVFYFHKAWVKYAAIAVLVGLLAATYLSGDQKLNNNEEVYTPVIVNNNILPVTNSATLTLEDGTDVILEKGVSYQGAHAKSNGEEIVYPAGESIARDKSAAINTLTIPRGGEFSLTLSDGTKIWLNSETQLKYPVSFTNDQTRQVELVYGEAYFEVSTSTKHNGAKFKISTLNQDVEVLGTKFNIRAYKDESNTYTALVEGSVAIQTAQAREVLEPNQLSVVHKKTHVVSVLAVDSSTEIAWVSGNYIVQNKNLKEIMKVLSRWYDMDVQFENKDLEKVQFRGILRKNLDITDILNTIKESGILKNYEIHHKTVILK